MERQYIFFKTARAFWGFACLAVLLMFTTACLVVYFTLPYWQVVSLLVLLSAFVTYLVYKLDSVVQ